MADIKIVKKSKVVKFPRAKGSVRATLNDAMDLAMKKKWNKVIVLGEGMDDGHWFYSAMSPTQAAGMLETAKYLMLRDTYK